nr:MAG TPA: hypothetical protein [Caudoviricetes sp.]DAK30339.1 MAG TPA: hypothetical protein [Caudoviricetes sp.]
MSSVHALIAIYRQVPLPSSTSSPNHTVVNQHLFATGVP